MKPRYYQVEAVQAVFDHLDKNKHGSNPCVVLPTGSGKTVVLAMIAQQVVQWGGRVCVLAHVRELLEQNAEKIQIMAPEIPVGIYSAGLKRRETKLPVIVAGIQSVYKRGCELGRFSVLIVDECHLISQNDDGMYHRFIGDAKLVNPNVKVIGMTATPFRLDCGYVCGPEHCLNEVVYEAGIKPLINEGYLCKLVSKQSKESVDTSSVKLRGGEFIKEDLQAVVATHDNTVAAVKEILERTFNRDSVLVFGCGVAHSYIIAQLLRQAGEQVGYIDGETDSAQRATQIERFRAGELRFMVNCEVLTTGFDAPNIDAVCILRPTMSPGLYSQMVGRGLRIHPDKKDCLVLDFGGNIERHGPIDKLKIKPKDTGGGGGEAPTKTCPMCDSVMLAGMMTCEDCGHTFERDVSHDPTSSDAAILSGPEKVETEWVDVASTEYHVHEKRGAAAGHPKTMRVTYNIGINERHSEWICVEHGEMSRFAYNKAVHWWKSRTDEDMPSTAEEAVRFAEDGLLCEPSRILLEWRGENPKYPDIIGADLGDLPGVRPLCSTDLMDEEIPF